MSYIRKFKPIHKRVLGYFGYTLLEAQSLSEDEKNELRELIQDAMAAGTDTPEELMLDGEHCLIGDEEFMALDDLTDMIYWPAAHTVLTNDGESLDQVPLAETSSSKTSPKCSSEPMPVCNYTRQVSLSNIAYSQGVLEDGMPFVAELYSMRPGAIGLNVVLPEITQFISDVNVGAASDFPDSIAEACDNGVLSQGMEYRERADSLEELMYYTQYLEDMGVVSFETDLREGDLETLSDLDGNPIVLDRITLVEDGKVLARANLRFAPFPEGPNRFFEEEWVRDNFDEFRISALLDALAEEDTSAVPPNCVFEDGEWRPCPYDDEVDSVFRPSEEGR